MSLKRTIAIFAVYAVACVAWFVLGGVTHARTNDQRHVLREQVASLWGEAHIQRAPSVKFRAVVPSESTATDAVSISEQEAGLLEMEAPPTPVPEKPVARMTPEERDTWDEELESSQIIWVEKRAAVPVSLDGTKIETEIHSDPRRKGLVWYSLYDVKVAASYVYRHESTHTGYLDLSVALPTSDAIYDALVFEVNGEDHRQDLDPEEGRFSSTLVIQPGDEVRFSVAYASRGAEQWRYDPGAGIQRLNDFEMSMVTDFAQIDFPTQTLSPTEKEKTTDGWRLSWDFASTVTGHGMGMVMPRRIQPGELSSELTFSAPISLMFFFIMLFVVATLRRIEIHPINYLFLAAAFFAFHLLFSYSVDHISVAWAFAISSAVSLLLVVSYLRLVVGVQFALREAAAGQFVYLIGFSLAHFWEGYTGLTVSILAIVTLFIVMQVTGRLKWAEVLRASPKAPRSDTAAPTGTAA